MRLCPVWLACAPRGPVPETVAIADLATTQMKATQDLVTALAATAAEAASTRIAWVQFPIRPDPPQDPVSTLRLLITLLAHHQHPCIRMALIAPEVEAADSALAHPEVPKTQMRGTSMTSIAKARVLIAVMATLRAHTLVVLEARLLTSAAVHRPRSAQMKVIIAKRRTQLLARISLPSMVVTLPVQATLHAIAIIPEALDIAREVMSLKSANMLQKPCAKKK